MEAQAVEHSETGEMTWVTTGEHGEVVQLSHGEHAFSAGTYTKFLFLLFPLLTQLFLYFGVDGTLVTVDASATEAEALSNMASTIATSLGIPMGTATTVTHTEDGITVAYLTTSDEHGQQYITVSGEAVDGETVTLVQQEDDGGTVTLVQQEHDEHDVTEAGAHPTEEMHELEESKPMDMEPEEAMMEN